MGAKSPLKSSQEAQKALDQGWGGQQRQAERTEGHPPSHNRELLKRRLKEMGCPLNEPPENPHS